MKNQSGKLTISQILEAFPDEARVMVPRERRRLQRELKPWFEEARRIKKEWWPDEHIAFALAILGYEKPKDKFRYLGVLMKLEKIMKMPIDAQISQRDIEMARNVPIFGLHTWKKFTGNPGKFMACCPFHEDDTPSFGVKGSLFNCFGCSVKGNVIAFAERLNGFNFTQAVQWLLKK